MKDVECTALIILVQFCFVHVLGVRDLEFRVMKVIQNTCELLKNVGENMMIDWSSAYEIHHQTMHNHSLRFEDSATNVIP